MRLPNFGCAVFVARSLMTVGESEGLRAIEVGANGIYGDYRSIVDLHGGFDEYVGVDISAGPGVDVVCDVADLVDKFGADSFDVVIATELIEHVQDWRKAVSQLKRVCRPGGVVVVTTRSMGYGYHAAPFDFWRFELGDMRRIFADCELLLLDTDLEEPGVFAAARKPPGLLEGDLSGLDLYSIVEGRRVAQADSCGVNRARFTLLILRAKFWQLGRWLFTYGEKDYGQIFGSQIKEIKALFSLMRGGPR